MTTTTNTLPDTRGPWRRESRALLTLALPMVFTELSYMAMSVTDTIMMGRLGALQLAAGALSHHFYALFFLVGIGVMNAVAPMAAQALGARQYRNVRRALRQGFWAAVAIGIPCMLVVWQAGALLSFAGQDPEVAAASQTYLRVVVWGLIPLLCYLALANFLAAHSRPRAALIVGLCAIPLNALGNYLLMYGHFGLPRLELVGAGISTLVVDGFMVLTLLAVVLRDRKLRRYHVLGRIWRPDWPRFIELFRIGLPSGLALVAEHGLFLASTLLIGLFGTNQLAAHGIAIECIGLTYMVAYGIGQAATVRVGLAAGRGDRVGIWMAGWTGLLWGCSIAVIPAIGFWFAGPALVSVFLDPTVAENAVAIGFAAAFLKIAAVFQLFDAMQVLGAGCLRGLKDTRVPMQIALLGYWGFGMTAAWIFAVELDYQGYGAWIGLAVGLGVTAPLMVWRFHRLIGRPKTGAAPATS